MFKIDTQVGAYFQLTVGKESTGEVTKQSGEFHNLVLDAGLERMGIGAWGNRIAVGTGNTPPDVSQTTLDALVAHVGVPTSYGSLSSTDSWGGEWQADYDPSNPPYVSRRFTSRFSAGTFNNVNLAEVGLGWDAGGGNVLLWNRELIKDALGNPSTITVLSDEFLDVTCEIRMYVSTIPNITTINIYDSFATDALPVATRSCKARMLRNSSPAGNAPDPLRAVGHPTSSNNVSLSSGADVGFWYDTTTPSGGIGNNDSYYGGYQVSEPYVSGSKAKTLGGGFPLPRGNGSIKCVIIYTSLGSYLLEYDTPIVKTADDKFEVRMTITWGRHVEA